MRLLGFFLAASCAASGVIRAQTPPSAQTAIVRGTVTNAAGEPLQYAVAALPAVELQQFTNSAGKFAFTAVPAGTYRLTIRQLGYTAVGIEVTVAAGENKDVSVRMERIITKLAAMRVLADVPCKKPGRPTGEVDSELAQVFEQVEQNAVRMRLLSAVYPYDAITERIRFIRHGDGLETIESHDSVRTPNQQNARYKAGGVVVERRGARTLQALANGRDLRETYMQLPTLLDFADKDFQDNHCFALRGIEDGASGKEVRVDFKPAEQLKSPDVSGSVFLEPESFRLLRADIELTKIPKSLPGLLRVQALTYFDEIMPGLPTVGETVATSDLAAATKMSPAQSVERLITLKIMFHKEIPDAMRKDSSSVNRTHHILR